MGIDFSDSVLPIPWEASTDHNAYILFRTGICAHKREWLAASPPFALVNVCDQVILVLHSDLGTASCILYFGSFFMPIIISSLHIWQAHQWNSLGGSSLRCLTFCVYICTMYCEHIHTHPSPLVPLPLLLLLFPSCEKDFNY